MKKYFLIFLLFASKVNAQNKLTHTTQGRSVIFTNSEGTRLRLTAYGNEMIRVQAVRKGEEFFADNRYEMVLSHQWPGKLSVYEDKAAGFFSVATGARDGLSVMVDDPSMRLSFFEYGKRANLCSNDAAIYWKDDRVYSSFRFDSTEHFTGLGHGYFAREESIDLGGRIITRNYGTEHGEQAPLIVPFFLSSKGYGIFVNSTFPNSFNFGKDGRYEFSLQGDARMDYFVINGPSFAKIIDNYTQLTGRPRMPLKAFFGLALSDKGNDHTSTDPSDEQWWKRKITQHRNAGLAIDHVINDNRWRAGGGQRCVSYFAWDSTRYPDPGEYAQWIKANGLITTLDFNRCIAVQSEGWKPSFNLPENRGIDFNTSAPDLTKKEVRDWFWNLMWTKTLNPALHYPGDALWIDEFDEMGKAPLSMKFTDGTTWQERRNYWFFLVAKALVQDGWDKSFKGTKRPFVWVRGMTAGAQRYATLWSGDINSTYADMRTQVRGMQLAGLSGFPFWGHDAGGFHKDDSKETPNDPMYRQWSMAFGSFTPFWKPHGVGKSRWPLDRSADVQKDARLYTELRYKLIPYLYTYAKLANTTGLPVARAMVIGHENDPLAWKADLQYMWGDAFLVAPNCSDNDNVEVWLPKGEWFDFWSDEKLNGGRTISYAAPVGKLPLFVKAGSIIPMANYALSTAAINSDSLTIHVYPGGDAVFNLYEDDGISEDFLYKNKKRVTAIHFTQASFSLNIDAAAGSYDHAPTQRVYEIIFHGLTAPICVEVNNVKINAAWDETKKLLKILLPLTPVNKKLTIKRSTGCQ